MRTHLYLLPYLALAFAPTAASARASVEASENAALPATVPGPVRAAVVNVIDGDTILVRADVWIGQVVETRVRLLGIDAPELHGRCSEETERARQAKATLAQLASTAVLLTDVRPDKYGGRVLAHVQTPDHVDVAHRMLDAGLARAYDGGHRAPWCR